MRAVERIRDLFERRSTHRSGDAARHEAVDQRSNELQRRAAIDALTQTPTEQFLAGRQQLSQAAHEAGLTVHEVNDALAARPDLPRPLLPIERDTLLAILGHTEFEGRDQLLAQVERAAVTGYCPCPCATVSLAVDPDAARALGAPRLVPVEPTVVDGDGQPIGGLIIFTDGGYLSELEIWGVTDPGGISPLPPLERLQFDEPPGLERQPA